MRKIPTLFERDPHDRRHVLPTVTEGCEWVLAGEGTATRKYDGVCVLVRGGAMFARQQVKAGGTPPPNFEPVDFDDATGKTQGWVPVTDAPEWARHHEAFTLARTVTFGRTPPSDGTYELCGPKVNGNPDGFPKHVLVPHGYCYVSGFELSFEGLREALPALSMEGLVWWREPGNPDSDLAKLKRRDFAQ